MHDVCARLRRDDDSAPIQNPGAALNKNEIFSTHISPLRGGDFNKWFALAAMMIRLRFKILARRSTKTKFFSTHISPLRGGDFNKWFALAAMMIRLRFKIPARRSTKTKFFSTHI